MYSGQGEHVGVLESSAKGGSGAWNALVGRETARRDLCEDLAPSQARESQLAVI